MLLESLNKVSSLRAGLCQIRGRVCTKGILRVFCTVFCAFTDDLVITVVILNFSQLVDTLEIGRNPADSKEKRDTYTGQL